MNPLFFDEDRLDRAVIQAMRRAGADCLSVGEAGRWRLPDDEQLAFAHEQGCAIYTSNVRDFARIHREWLQAGHTHSGIILLTDQLAPIGLQVRCLEAIIALFGTPGLKDSMIFALNYAK